MKHGYMKIDVWIKVHHRKQKKKIKTRILKEVQTSPNSFNGMKSISQNYIAHAIFNGKLNVKCCRCNRFYCKYSACIEIYCIFKMVLLILLTAIAIIIFQYQSVQQNQALAPCVVMPRFIVAIRYCWSQLWSNLRQLWRMSIFILWSRQHKGIWNKYWTWTCLSQL